MSVTKLSLLLQRDSFASEVLTLMISFKEGRRGVGLFRCTNNAVVQMLRAWARPWVTIHAAQLVYEGPKWHCLSNTHHSFRLAATYLGYVRSQLVTPCPIPFYDPTMSGPLR